MKKFKIILGVFLTIFVVILVLIFIEFNIEYKIYSSFKGINEADVTVTSNVEFDGNIYIANNYYYEINENKLVIKKDDNEYLYQIDEGYSLNQEYYYSRLFLYNNIILFTISKDTNAKIISFDLDTLIYNEIKSFDSEYNGKFSTFVNLDNRIFEYEVLSTGFLVWEYNYETQSFKEIKSSIIPNSLVDYSEKVISHIDKNDEIYFKRKGLDFSNKFDTDGYSYTFSYFSNFGNNYNKFTLWKNKNKEVVASCSVEINANMGIFYSTLYDYNNKNVYCVISAFDKDYLLIFNYDTMEISYKCIGKIECLNGFVNGNKLYIGWTNNYICVEL